MVCCCVASTESGKSSDDVGSSGRGSDSNSNSGRCRMVLGVVDGSSRSNKIKRSE